MQPMKTRAAARRQFATDEYGERIAVILPIEEYQLIESLLVKQVFPDDQDKLALIRKAMDDPGFVADLEETMHAFRAVDAEWWEAET